MKKFVRALLAITLLLSAALAWNLWKQHIEQMRPPGSSGISEGTRILVSSRIGSRIQKMLVDEGDRVQAGQTLAELDCVDYDAQVAAAQARRDANKLQADGQRAQAGSIQVQEGRAKKDSQRALQLQRDKAIDDVTVESLTTTAADFSQKVSAARSQTFAAERQFQAAQAELKRALSSQAECKVVAPRSGVISVRAREAGEVVLPGASIFEMVDDSKMKVKFYVTNQDLGRVQVGMKVEAIADAFTDIKFSGTVTRISDTAEFTPKTVQTRSDRDRLVYAAEADIQNENGKIRTGMPMEISVIENNKR